jgi:hypothetical protein
VGLNLHGSSLGAGGSGESSTKKKPMNIYSVSIYAIGGPINPIALPSTMHQEFLNMGKTETISCKKPENFPEMENTAKIEINLPSHPS